MFKLFLLFLTQIFLIKGINGSCKRDLHFLGETQKNFLICAVENSESVKRIEFFQSCRKCIEPYKNMILSYNHLVTNCSKDFFDKNRLNMVYQIENVLEGIWKNAHCDECFKENGTDPTENTHIFFEKKLKYDTCLDETRGANETCVNCNQQYVDLNNFYLKNETKGNICFDIQDAMNRTRSHWSKDLKCCEREFDLILFYIASAVFSLLPLLFYSGMYSYTKRIERNHEAIDANSPENNGPVSDSIIATPISVPNENLAASIGDEEIQNEAANLEPSTSNALIDL